jgi:hypothetical protein
MIWIYPQKLGRNTGREGSCDAVLVYDNNLKELRSAGHCRRFAGSLLGSADFRLQAWRLCLVGQPVDCEEALNHAARADVVIFAVQHQTVLTLNVERWITDWVSLRLRRPGRLMLATVDPDLCESCQILRSYLVRAAYVAGMSFQHVLLRDAAGDGEKVVSLLPGKAGAAPGVGAVPAAPMHIKAVQPRGKGRGRGPVMKAGPRHAGGPSKSRRRAGNHAIHDAVSVTATIRKVDAG